MFRAYCYFNSVRMTSEGFGSIKTANDVLDEMIERGATGGDIEQEVPGIGWVIASEVESVVLIHNRWASDNQAD